MKKRIIDIDPSQVLRRMAYSAARRHDVPGQSIKEIARYGIDVLNSGASLGCAVSQLYRYARVLSTVIWAAARRPNDAN